MNRISTSREDFTSLFFIKKNQSNCLNTDFPRGKCRQMRIFFEKNKFPEGKRGTADMLQSWRSSSKFITPENVKKYVKREGKKFKKKLTRWGGGCCLQRRKRRSQPYQETEDPSHLMRALAIGNSHNSFRSANRLKKKCRVEGLRREQDPLCN